METPMIYKVERGYVVSSGDFWLPGLYESEKAAARAGEFKRRDLQALQDRKNEAAGGMDGVITLADMMQIGNS